MKPFNLFPYDSNFNFMRWRWIALVIAVGMMLTAIGLMAIKSFNFALDFTGGTAVELRFARAVDVDGLRERLAEAGLGQAQVQAYGDGNDLLVRLQPREGAGRDDTSQTAEQVLRVASLPGNPASLLSSGYVGPQIGKELAQNGVYALLLVLLGFLVYISYRFEWKFAVAAIFTTLNDVLTVAGWFALTGREFDLTVLAGVLSVLGYSINDTIVVFDRVRENFKSMRASPEEILNKSVNQTLSRTVITSFVAFLTVLALYLYGGGSLQGMAESQMVGILIGTVSTIFVACPILLLLGVNKQDLMPKARDDAALARRP